MESQEQNRFRFWEMIEEMDNRSLRVITLEDKTTIHNAFFEIHNAFFDRRFKL